MRNLKVEYMNSLILNQNVQNNLIYLSTVFSIKENLMINFLRYVYSFIRFDYILQTVYKDIFIYYIFKAKLSFFINEVCFVNNIKFFNIFLTFFFKNFIFLNFFYLLQDFLRNVFNLFFISYFKFEAYFEKNKKFSSFSLLFDIKSIEGYNPKLLNDINK
jgi:hypothetical protein